MLPDIVKQFLITERQSQGCFCLAINEKLNIIQYFGKAKQFGVSSPKFDMSIVDFLPVLISESFESNFEIPFYNIDDNNICNIYFLKSKKVSYLMLVKRNEIFQAIQKHQQSAHDDNIKKNKFKRLSEDLQKAKKKLNKANQEKATLIAMLSHELGTPLTSIIGYSELLLTRKTDTRKGLEIINRNAIHLKHMIENTLLFGRSEAGAMQTQVDSISLQQLFTELKATLMPAAINKKLDLLMFHRSNQKINIDITRSKQILINLLNNAIKYTETGSVELKFSQINNNYVFSVIDTGLGIAKELQSTIFNPWERIQENSEPGSGIGLFISNKLAQAIGGSLKLKYSSKENGSIFQLLIPIQEKQSDDQIKEKEIKLQDKDKSILIIDDDSDILILIEALLNSSKLKIYTATNYKQAQLLLKTKIIDIVLTDLNLGEIKATTFIKDIKSLYNKLPVLLMSAMPSNTIKQQYKELGFSGIVSKPINSKKLLLTIAENL